MIQISQRALKGSLPLQNVCSLEGGLAAKKALLAFEFAARVHHCIAEEAEAELDDDEVEPH